MVHHLLYLRLPGVLDAVQGKCEIWVDGGIRTGQDILRLIALGAQKEH